MQNASELSAQLCSTSTRFVSDTDFVRYLTLEKTSSLSPPPRRRCPRRTAAARGAAPAAGARAATARPGPRPPFPAAPAGPSRQDGGGTVAGRPGPGPRAPPGSAERPSAAPLPHTAPAGSGKAAGTAPRVAGCSGRCRCH